jgi:hypothetical protein
MLKRPYHLSTHRRNCFAISSSATFEQNLKYSDLEIVIFQDKIERSISQYIAFVFRVDTLVDTVTFFIHDHDLEIGLNLGYWPKYPDQLTISTRQIYDIKLSKTERINLK